MKAAQAFIRDMRGIAARNPESHFIQAFCKSQIGLTLAEIEAQSAEGARASGKASARSAGLQALPDGNHGENVSTGSGL